MSVLLFAVSLFIYIYIVFLQFPSLMFLCCAFRLFRPNISQMSIVSNYRSSKSDTSLINSICLLPKQGVKHVKKCCGLRIQHQKTVYRPSDFVQQPAELKVYPEATETELDNCDMAMKNTCRGNNQGRLRKKLGCQWFMLFNSVSTFTNLSYVVSVSLGLFWEHNCPRHSKLAPRTIYCTD